MLGGWSFLVISWLSIVKSNLTAVVQCDYCAYHVGSFWLINLMTTWNIWQKNNSAGFRHSVKCIGQLFVMSHNYGRHLKSWDKIWTVHYETFACRMKILHYSLTKLSKRRVSGSIKLFIYSNEHFEMAQGQKSGWKEGGKPCFVQFFKNQDKFKKRKKWKNIKFLFLIFFFTENASLIHLL